MATWRYGISFLALKNSKLKALEEADFVYPPGYVDSCLYEMFEKPFKTTIK